ncbi:MAG TPA: bifunctional UDP-N-acetylglucosamine diphosphorylase/glucosamine-1-phosphate N-acetyltransferase GlmU [Chloroflexia bacterium]|nr:bifunctional UDP-N-acetylglucosamine diphosphorylase/glucosamine-1-phosphate N-acetyltransferase GlmU [Chloroflexia bacterium]
MTPLTEEGAPPQTPTLVAVVLAAGMGTRMRSTLPKVLHQIAGVPLVGHVLRALAPLAPARTVLVIGHGGAQVQATVGPDYTYVTQAPQLGTGHAVLQARPAVEGQAQTVLVLYGDTPLLRAPTLQDLVTHHATQPGTRVTILTCHTPDPSGYGRVLRDSQGRVTGIVEERVATPDQRAITETNSGIYCFDSAWLWPRLAALPLHPGTGEYFLTDMIGLAIAEDPACVQTRTVSGLEEAAGINNRVQLAEAEAMIRDRLRRHWMLEGVTMIDPRTTYVDADVVIGPDTILDPGCYLRGTTRIGAGCRIGPQAQLVDATVGDGCVVGSSLLEGCTLEAGVDVGSFNHLRAGAYLARGVHLGNFAEVKNARLGPQVAMGHFSYIGDADIGAGTNIGAGTITVNYSRGGTKQRTQVGAGVFLGSDSLLIAPVEVGAGAATGAGAVVTKNVPPGALVVGVPARIIRWLTDPGVAPAADAPAPGGGPDGAGGPP